jgi:hypothetical protein
MNNITDDELTLLYYGEQNDPTLAALVAGSPELSARFETLCTELERIDALVPPERGDDYGSEVWRRIAPRLAQERTDSGNRWISMLSALRQPQFSLAGVASIAMVAALAFMLGRQGGQPTDSETLDAQTLPAMVQAEIDSGRLLNTTVSDHLEQLNIVLTQFVNNSETSTGEAERATDMLVANRLYRQAATTRGEHKLAAFLGEIEPLLIEMAYEAYKNSPSSRERMQQEVSDGLLFRVRVMNKQLINTRIST